MTGRKSFDEGARTEVRDQASVAAELVRTNGALRLLGLANQTLLRATDEAALVNEVCRLVVDAGAAICWAGLWAEGSLHPAGCAGDPDGFLAPGGSGWACAIGPGSAAERAQRTDQPQVVREVTAAPDFERCRSELLARGLGSAVALPMSSEPGSPPLGVLLLFTAEAEGSGVGELAVLQGLAGNLGFGIRTLRAAAQQRAAQRELYVLNRALDESYDPVYVIEGGTSRLQYVNQAAAAMLGYRREELTGGMTVYDLDPAFGPGGFGDRWRARGVPYHARFETHHRARSGELIPVEVVTSRFAYEGITLNLAMARDLRERKATEAKLLEHELLYQSVVTALREGVMVHGEEGRVLMMNPAAERILGLPAATLVGTLPDLERWALTREDGSAVPVHALPQLETLRTGLPCADVALSFVRADGQRVWLSVSTQPLLLPGEGRPHAVVATLRDVTDERAAVAALRARERDYRTLAENTPDLVVRWDPQLRRVFVNQAFAAAVGVEGEAGELTGTAFGTRYAPSLEGPVREALAPMEARIREAFATGTAAEFELRWPTAHGSRTYTTRLIPERGERGEVVTVLGVSHDVTSLKESVRQFRSLAEHSPDLVLRLDREGRYLFANAAIEGLSGLPAEYHLGKVVGEVVGPGPAGRLTGLFAELRRRLTTVWDSGDGWEGEAVFPLATGERLLEVRMVPERTEGGETASVLVLVRDVTARRRTEAALQASERRLLEVTEHIDEVFRLSEVSTGQIVYVSPAYPRVFGRSVERLLADPAAWLEPVRAEDRERVAAALSNPAEGGSELEYRILKGDEVCWVHERAFPIRDDSGQVVRIAAVAQDVTRRRRLEEDLRQAQKMEAVGRLAGGIAHDFNNILAVIQLETSLQLEAGPATADARQGLESILATSTRAANLTRQLLAFSRRQVPKMAVLDLSDVVGGMSKLLRRVLGEDIAFETRLAPTALVVRADAGMLEQVLMNLVINARDAMPEGGRLTVEVDGVHVDERRAAAHRGAAPGPYVRLRVTDTGSGIAPEVLPHLFEPFFTTKEVGKGTGLGLPTAFGIIEQHQGWFEVESELGRRTTFAVLLPALASSAQPAVAPAGPVAAGFGHETVLLVEDDLSVRAASRVSLERYGYRVLEAESAASALEVWSREGARVDLVLTDLVMPGGTTGRQLAEALVRQAPRLRVLYTSGYSPDVVNRLLPLDEGRAFLQKPCTAVELALAVRRRLDEPAAPSASTGPPRVRAP
jgi:two-component system, cell cycle sensor histidine kinase and response regulator CckA